MNRTAAVSAFLLLLLLSLVAWPLPPAGPPPRAEEQPSLASLLDALVARPLGPANMGGRIADIAVVENRPGTIYLAAASGGLWKTGNNGTTWAPVFDNQPTVSLGAVAVAPSNPDIVWAGTGEANARNSVSWGDGVYKSTDSGQTWQNMGLKDSEHIGRIRIHPKNPDVVYVAALGHLWGPNPQRGLYKTTDGGKTWQRSLFLNEDTGCIDLAIHPDEPDTLYAAAYRVRRGPFAGGNPAVQTGPEAGLYKTTDGGKTWQRLTRGLPDRPLGRCGLDVYRKDPRIVYAVIQTDKTTLVRETEWGQPAKTSSQADSGGVFRSEDGGQSWVKVNDLCPRPFYFSLIRVDPRDPDRVYVGGLNLHVSRDGGKTFSKDGGRGMHADHHALWIDPNDSTHLIAGNDGGLYFSYDRGSNWEAIRNMPLGQFYGVAVDMRKPYWVYGGLQDNGSWGGPSATRSAEGITASDWTHILGADGFQCQADPADADTVYAETQYGGLARLNVRTGAARDIQPKAAERTPAYRFNWSAPVLLSPHNPRTVYFGGNHLFRSVNRGDTWEVISPDLTHGGPGPSPDQGHTITTIAQSPMSAGVLWAGTDDGRVQVTRNGGLTWTDVGDRVPGVPVTRWITRIEASRFAEGTAYLAIDRHRHDDRRPYVFRTLDYGASWQNVTKNLPAEGPVHVIREDPRNRDLLFVGTEFGLFASLDAGSSWQRLKAGLPTVAVHDLVIHPRDRDLVIGTHGRSVYVLDVSPLEELTPRQLTEAAYLCDVKPATRFRHRGARELGSSKVYGAPNPPSGAGIWYYLKEKPQTLHIVITDAQGSPVASVTAAEEPGLHRVSWDLRTRTGGVPAGDYLVRLEVGDRTVVKKLHVDAED
jgi:photosystem II stability/assembly factor-like uncharacterized protein